MRTPENWRQHLDGLTTRNMAQNIIGDLIGYNLFSRHRPEDEQSLENAIAAITAMAQGKPK